MKRAMNRIAVIGSGFSGLITAYELTKQIKAADLPYEVVVLDSANRIGGVTYTDLVGEAYVDVGPQELFLHDKKVRDLLNELNLMHLVEYRKVQELPVYYQRAFISPGVETYQGVPLHINDTWLMDNLTFREKYEFYLNYRNSSVMVERLQDKLSAFELLYGCFGRTVYNTMISPHYSDLRYGDPALVPLKEYDPFMLSLLSSNVDNNELPIKGRLMPGMSVLINALASRLNRRIELNQMVNRISLTPNGLVNLEINYLAQINVGAAIIATANQELLRTVDSRNEMINDNIFHKRVAATLVFEYHRDAFPKHFRHQGFVTPKRSDSIIDICCVLNNIYPSFSDKEAYYIYVQVGREGFEELITKLEEELLAIVEEELMSIFAIKERAQNAKVYVYNESEIYQPISEQVKSNHTFQIAKGVFGFGQSYFGQGIHRAIDKGQSLANEVMDYMETLSKDELG